jgi:glycosyltransferase involved in cell wall biosynthesis
MPRVSIGLPVYNGDRFLDEAMRSLLAQTYRDFEIIISDNGSTDRTEEICRRYAAEDNRIRYYRETTNQGASWNYNRVVQLATGEFFKWAAHDDLITPDYLAKCIAVLDRDPGVVLCCTDDQDIDEQGKYVDAKRHSHIPSAERGSAARVSLRFRRLIRDDYDCEQVFGLYRLDVLRKTKLILSYTDSDRTLLAETGLYGRLFEIQEPLFLHRQHGGSSCKANPITSGWHARISWFDPRLAGKALFSRWRQLREYAVAIVRSPIRIGEKVACFFWLLMYQRGRIKPLAREIAVGVKLLLFPPPAPPQTPSSAAAAAPLGQRGA